MGVRFSGRYVDDGDDDADTDAAGGDDGHGGDYAGVDAKQRCLPELHDVPYDTPPPSNQPAATAAATAAAAGCTAAASGGLVRRTTHDELMDEPIYANAAAHPPVTGTAFHVRCFLWQFVLKVPLNHETANRPVIFISCCSSVFWLPMWRAIAALPLTTCLYIIYLVHMVHK